MATLSAPSPGSPSALGEALVFSSLECCHWVLSLLSAVCALKATPHHREVSFSGQEQRMEGAGGSPLGCEAQEASEGPGPHVHGRPEWHGAPGPQMGLECPEHPHSAGKTQSEEGKKRKKDCKRKRGEGAERRRVVVREQNTAPGLCRAVCTDHTPRTFRREGWGQGAFKRCHWKRSCCWGRLKAKVE